MELWKGASIGAMLLLIVGYGVAQNRPLQDQASPPKGTDGPAPKPTEAPNPAVDRWIGKEPVPWSFPASSWINTPRPLTPADLKGKVTLMEFWRSGCSHCEEAVPFMERARGHFGKRLQMITFQSPGVLNDPENDETSWDKVKDWATGHGITYPVAFDTDRKVKDKYNVSWYPFVLLVDKSGRIVYAHTGHDNDKAKALAAKLESLLGK